MTATYHVVDSWDSRIVLLSSCQMSNIQCLITITSSSTQSLSTHAHVEKLHCIVDYPDFPSIKCTRKGTALRCRYSWYSAPISVIFGMRWPSIYTKSPITPFSNRPTTPELMVTNEQVAIGIQALAVSRYLSAADLSLALLLLLLLR